MKHSIENLRNIYPNNFLKDNLIAYALLSFECDFHVEFEGESIINEESWNIVEFVNQINKWLSNGMKHNFIYECLDSQDLDLFTIELIDKNYLIKTRSTNSKIILTKQMLALWINRLKEDLIIELKKKFGLENEAIKILETNNGVL